MLLTLIISILQPLRTITYSHIVRDTKSLLWERIQNYQHEFGGNFLMTFDLKPPIYSPHVMWRGSLQPVLAERASRSSKTHHTSSLWIAQSVSCPLSLIWNVKSACQHCSVWKLAGSRLVRTFILQHIWLIRARPTRYCIYSIPAWDLGKKLGPSIRSYLVTGF